jgi:hypothetical protein
MSDDEGLLSRRGCRMTGALVYVAKLGGKKISKVGF